MTTLSRHEMEQLIFGGTDNQRFTQDSPILPEVWLKYALHPDKARDLILIPDRSSNAGAFANDLNDRLRAYRKHLPKGLKAVRLRDGRHKRARIAHLPGVVAARLYFDEFLRLVLPATPWWRKMVNQYRDKLEELENAGKLKGTPLYKQFADPRVPFDLEKADVGKTSKTSLVRKLAEDMVAVEALAQASINSTRDYSRPRAAFVQTARIAGAVASLFLERELPKVENGHFRPRNKKEMAKVGGKRNEPFRVAYDHIEIARSFLTLFEDWPGPQSKLPKDQDEHEKGEISPPPVNQIWRVSLNRDVTNAVARSTLACKADAARLLFNVNCEKVIWAIADSGIDAHHPAFFDWRGTSGRSRVLRTFDFRELRESLSLDQDKVNPDLLDRLEEGVRAEIAEKDEKRMSNAVLRSKAKDRLQDLVNRLYLGADVDWALLEPLVAIDEKFVPPPTVDHGSHVAGILAADWPMNPKTGEAMRPEEVYRPAKMKLLDEGARNRCATLARDMVTAMEDGIAARAAGIRPPPATGQDMDDENEPAVITNESLRHMTGMCPDIRLYDFRVLRQDGQSDEFEVIAALQFIRFLNARAGSTMVHGVNLSLSIEHDVANYACGNTPICEECDQLAANGTVVVAAAGNLGHAGYGLGSEARSGGYNAISITDPGNAEGVITVGSTHRYKPHVFGPSYFSSRGPTGDGRLKPDLVAPGEKIKAPVGLDDEAYKDGTSMAAPHVSGAAAILMARHIELIGQPAKIKKILCETATDLGRERYFQGAGMLDVLRALQSV
ncbi:MAG: S8 family serine peptidase [Geminicoccaceae bacterium]